MSVVAGVLMDGQTVDKAALRRYLERRETPNLLDYGADPTGKQDSAPALQRALDESRGRKLEVPAGTYALSRGVIVKAPATAHVPAPQIVGAGSGATRFDLRGAGPLLTVDQSAAYRFASQGALSGLTLTGDRAVPGQTGLRLSGAWGWTFSDLSISGFSGDGIECPNRTDLGPNPDGFQTVLRLEDCRIARCGGWGIDSAAGTGLIATLIDCALQECAAGGARISGPFRWVGGMAVGCGAAAGNEGSGLTLYKAPGMATPQMLSLERIEFDGNYGVHVRLEAALGGRIQQCRFISRMTGRALTAAAAVRFGNGKGDSVAGGARGIEIEQCYVRVPADAGAPPYTAFDVGTPASYAHITVRGVQWVALAPHHRKMGSVHPDAHVRLEEPGATNGAQPPALVAKEHGPPTVLAAKQTEQAIPPNRVAVIPFDRALRLPAAGLWRIDAFITLVGAAPGDIGELSLIAGAKTLRISYHPILTAARQTISLSVTSPLDGGVTVELRLKLSNGGGARVLAGGELSSLQAALQAG